MIKRNKYKILLLGILAVLALKYIYPYCPYKVEFLGFYDEKIWAHRVNSTEKLSSALKYYNGVELDLVYNEKLNVLDVNHPPTESINLSFENYLKTLNDDQQPYLWLDIKNLEQENAHVIFNRLQSLFGNRAYPIAKVLIETRFPEALPIFTEAGYLTSYYLPYDLISKSSKNLNKEILKISKVLKNQPKIGISTNYIDYQIIRNHFPEKTKYIWALVSSINKSFLKTRAVLKDETVKVVLVNYKVLKGNR